MVVGLRGMIGYTAVIAVSQKGVSGSILAEEPIFERMDHTESSDSDFYQLGFEYLVRADRSYDGPGLYNLVEPGGLLAPETGPKVFILTPWPTPAERRRGIRTRFRWQRKIDQLRANLAGVFGREPAVVGYTRRSREDVEGHTPTGTRPWASIGGRAIVEVDMNDQQIELEPSIVASLGRWRLWVEERMVHSEAFCP
ncbi:hypothetical protein EV356DRAFT_521031 [Viridothelium virens]|uniref:Uncharacterized protein n=1 Tax=Viridothelium virens TaxID=1048519 RepID=A0A6A6GUV1_VIRVR|nr:hypothetical protein EV356DRAFT_521031 [Viridothelium virens]